MLNESILTYVVCSSWQPEDENQLHLVLQEYLPKVLQLVLNLPSHTERESLSVHRGGLLPCLLADGGNDLMAGCFLVLLIFNNFFSSQ